MARPEKTAAVKDITQRFEDADATLLTEYRGLRVAEIAELRASLREANADYKVMKNTLARIAVREVGLDELAGMLEGPTAVVFVQGDIAAAAKALDEAAKKFPVLVIKGGTLKGGKIFDAAQAKALASIEPREVLLAKVAQLFNSPAQQGANVLSALLRNFGSMLAQVVAQKEAEAPAPAPASEASPAAETPAPSQEPAEGAEQPGEVEQPDIPTPSQEPAEGADDSSAEPTVAQTTGADEADDAPKTDEAPEGEAVQAEAGEPEPPVTEEPDPAAEAATEASAGTDVTETDKEEE
jgi:large subunit ribosomal protein L10